MLTFNHMHGTQSTANTLQNQIKELPVGNFTSGNQVKNFLDIGHLL